MFTRAGFNPRHTVVCHARVALGNDGRIFTARLIRFEPSGDLAWHSRSGSFLVWGERVRIVGRVFIGYSPDDWSNIASHHRRLAAARAAGVLQEAA